MQYLTIALTKGRLAGQTMELFERAGYFCEELKDKKSRKLIFTNEEQKLRFFLSKGPDVPTYVEYGAADIGVVGSDIILEEQRRCHEVLDLGFGKCRMCVAGPPEARELLKHHEMIRVASKYPNIAKEYFYNRKHQTVDIIKLNGSVELGPIVELADVIVDIVETGSTLKANRLEPAEPVKAQEIRTATYVSKQTHDDIYNRKLAFKPDIDVRGMRGDEAIQTVMHFIDDATLIGMSRVRILHGTGNGILRNLIRQYLHTVPAVKDYHDEHIQFGGHGITVVDLG